MSSPNSRYKAPLVNNDESFEHLIRNLNQDRMAVSRIYKTGAFKQPITDLVAKLNDSNSKVEKFVMARSPASTPRKSIANLPSEVSKPTQRASRGKLELCKQSDPLEVGNGSSLRYSFRTKKGQNPNNPTKPNQDSYLLFPSIRNQD
jgi:hypothetical protein